MDGDDRSTADRSRRPRSNDDARIGTGANRVFLGRRRSSASGFLRRGAGPMIRLRVALLADYLEEGWPSMDLVAEMLVDRLNREHASTIDAVLIRPPLRRRLSRLSDKNLAFGVDRIAGRLWDYPRFATEIRGRFDLFHVVDHSYAQLVHRLPADRTVVSCHDLDTFRSVLEPERERRGAAFRAMTRRILDGLCKAGHVACDTEATRTQLIERAQFPESRTSVVHN